MVKMADFVNDEEEDIISRLPNEILTHILSFIPTKSAVATSVLSKRWHRVWISVPNLDFVSDFTCVSDCPIKSVQFVNFVDRVLSLNTSLSVREINLHCFWSWGSYRVIDWISSIVERDAEVFDLRLPELCRTGHLEGSFRLYSLPDSFYIRKNLVKLKLENIVLKVPSLVCFPSLETLSLKFVRFLNGGDDGNDDDVMKKLLSSCPVLKSLCIHLGSFLHDKTFYIVSSTLHGLELDMGCYRIDFGYDAVIDAPNLAYIHFIDNKARMAIDTISVPSLVKASLSLRRHDREVSPVYETRLIAFLRKISHVKELILDATTIHNFDKVPFEHLPMFNELTRLKVEVDRGDRLPILPQLFHCMPNLINFTLRMGAQLILSWYEFHEVPQCLLSSLENVEIIHYEECDVEMGLIKYILKHALVLKKLSIQSFCLDLGKETQILKELLLTWRRRSGVCEVEYRNVGSQSLLSLPPLIGGMN